MANKNNSPVNIKFVAKTSDIRNFSANIRLKLKHEKWQHWSQQGHLQHERERPDTGA